MSVKRTFRNVCSNPVVREIGREVGITIVRVIASRVVAKR